MKIFYIYIFSYFFIGKISYIYNSKYEDVLSAIKELIYNYYMRQENIQYSDGRCEYFPPEDATRQNVKYSVCTYFVHNIYKELLNISIPKTTGSYYGYIRKYLGEPESLLYSEINKENTEIRDFYIYSKEKNNYTKTNNFSLKELIPLLQIGDVLTYTGHTQIIYDVEKDSNGNVIDAFILESIQQGAYIKTKNPREEIAGPNGRIQGFAGSTLYMANTRNNYYEEGLNEGTLRLIRISDYNVWKDLNKISPTTHSIIRIINKDINGNAVLRHKTMFPNIPHKYNYNDKINLTDKDIDRTQKFKRLYIEKLVNKFSRNTVILGDILKYTIIIKNMWKSDYNYDLIVTENVSKFVTYESHFENNTVISFNYNIEKRQLIWNIGKLKKNEEFVINYLVRVTSGKAGDIIKSTGLVAHIPSSFIENYIGTNLNKNQMESIKNTFEKLKSKYNGKKLINEIYKAALNKDLHFDTFNISELIYNTDPKSVNRDTIGLNKNHSYYRAILNKYWSTMLRRTFLYDKNKEEAVIYFNKYFLPYDDPERRKDFIIKEDFKTGDILLYINTDDQLYHLDTNGNIIINKVTYEDGEYSYIYIEGKGFVGINLGNDGIKNTKDDRNEFNAKYYKDYNLVLAERKNNPSEEFLEKANLQTLLGKNYYVILRPSLCFDFPKSNNNTLIFVFLIFSGIIITALGLLILWKYINMKKNGIDFNFNNLKSVLLFNYQVNK